MSPQCLVGANNFGYSCTGWGTKIETIAKSSIGHLADRI